MRIFYLESFHLTDCINSNKMKSIISLFSTIVEQSLIRYLIEKIIKPIMWQEKKFKAFSFLLLSIANKCFAGSFHISTDRQRTSNLAEIYYFYP
jgi:hypothetical protein